MFKKIDSVQNKIIKEVISLNIKKNRDKKGLFLLEGERLVSEAKVEDIEYIVISKSYKGYVPKVNKGYVISDVLFSKICDTINPQGIIAVCKSFDYKIKDIKLENNPFFVMLENVMDPGNMGTIIRTADAAGVDGVILSKGCVDIFNPKVIRSTMGSIFHLPIYRNVELGECIKCLNKKNILTIGAHLKGENTPYNTNLKNGCCVVIGNEANGLSDEISNLISSLVKIPMPGMAESMNAGIAAGILIYEGVRQRLGE